MTEQKRTPALHSLSTSEALSTLASRSEGLTEEEVRERRGRFGFNVIEKTRRLRIVGVLAQQFSSPLIFVLIAAAILTSILQEWVDTAVIALAVLVNTGLGFYQEYRAEHTLEKLTTYIKERTRVLRDGIEQEIDSSQLVPGDIIHLSYGSRIPADARLLTTVNLGVDESVLTGESLPVRKKSEAISGGATLAERLNMVFAGTLVVEGYAQAVVTATGGASELGRIARLVSETKRVRTPLQQALWRLAWLIFFGVLSLVTAIFLLGLMRGEPVLEMLLLSAAVSVGAIPEALPIALTVILAVGVERLAARRGVMRSLAAAETLGSATVVMTDKTGTLTEANMRLVSVGTLEDLISNNELADRRATLPPQHLFVLSAALRNVDILVQNPTKHAAQWSFVGRPLEVSIARGANEHGLDLLTIREGRRIALPFNSVNKFSVSEDNATGDLFILGAPDILLERSRLSKEQFLAAEGRIRAMSLEGKRILGVARLPKERVSEALRKKPEHVRELEFLGALILFDPLRPEVPAALRWMEAHGVSVVMATGDLKGTAMAVARELGWKVHEGNVLTGTELEALSDEQLRANIRNIKIFARVTPEDKLRIARAYQSLGEVVAMTGDGVNDAPSLKAVDIGTALGSGSDVAKSAADLVVLDDNFKTIVSAIEEGRRILANIRKVFVYLMSNSLDQVFLIGGSLLAGLPLPLTALQIIWVNFFTGSLPALAFAFDANHDAERGKHRVRSIFNTEVKVLTIWIGVLTSLLLFVLYWVLLRMDVDLATARATIFVCSASYILVVAYSFRSLRRPLFSFPTFANRFLNFSVLAAAGLLVLTITLPAARDLFALAPLPLSMAWIVVGWLILNVCIVEITKWVFRHSR